MPELDLSVDHLISHTDEELIEWIYEELNTDASYALVNELIERYRPGVRAEAAHQRALRQGRRRSPRRTRGVPGPARCTPSARHVG